MNLNKSIVWANGYYPDPLSRGNGRTMMVLFPRLIIVRSTTFWAKFNQIISHYTLLLLTPKREPKIFQFFVVLQVYVQANNMLSNNQIQQITKS